MKILVVSFDIIPGRSGAWTTTCDLLERDHELYFLCGRAPIGTEELGTVIEGHKIWYFGYDPTRCKKAIELIKDKNNELQFDFDFALCLGDRESMICAEMGIPFMTRYHTLPFDINLARRVKENAFWTIENHDLPELNDIRDDVIPHCIDPERYTECYKHHLELSWDGDINAVLLATLNWVEDPITFVQAVKSCKNVIGYVIGDGVMADEVARATEASRGRCFYVGSRNRKDIPNALMNMHVGVACLSSQSKNNRQLKILEYAAAGVYPIVSCHAKMEARLQSLWYGNAGELIMHLKNAHDCGFISDKNYWLPRNRKEIEENWNARKWAKTFNKKLEEKFDNR